MIAALLLCAGVSSAAELSPAPSAFQTGFVPAVRLSLAGDALYASRLLTSFDEHLALASGLGSAPKAAAYLSGQIGDLKSAARGLGTAPLAHRQAAAILAASALAAPAQFAEAASRLEAVKPGLGARLAGRLKALGRDVKLSPPALTYGRDGKLDLLFDGGR